MEIPTEFAPPLKRARTAPSTPRPSAQAPVNPEELTNRIRMITDNSAGLTFLNDVTTDTSDTDSLNGSYYAFRDAYNNRPLSCARSNSYLGSISESEFEDSTADLSGSLSDIRNILLRAMSNSILVVLTIIMFATIISSGPAADTGIIGSFMNTTGNTTLSRWIRASPMRFYGILSFIPSVYSLPRKYSAIAAIVAFLWVIIVPEYSILEYFIQSTSLYVYFQTNRRQTKIFVVILALLAYYFGIIIVAPV